MAYPFEYTVKRKPYEFTFLNVILVNMTYGGKIQDKYEEFKAFFQEAFKLELSRERFDEIATKSIQISSDDKFFNWSFKANTVSVRIAGEAYISFDDTLLPLLEICNLLLSNISKKCVNVYIQKVNLFPLEQTDKSELFEILDKVVLSKSLVELRPEQPYVEEAKLLLFKNSFSNEDGTNHAVVVSGFIADQSEYPSRIVLDISATETNPDGLSLTDDFQRINNIVDGAFFWSVNTPIVELMENGVK